MAINGVITKKLVTGITLRSQKPQDPICEPCLAGKMHANPFLASNNRASSPLKLIHSDVHDVNQHTFTGYRYWVTFIDDYSQYKFVFPIKKKSEVLQTFKNFKVYTENQSGCRVKTLHDDKGGEHMSNEFNQFTTSCGIACQHTVRNHPQQNRVVEQANCLLSDRIAAMLNESVMPKIFWGKCLAALVHTWNRSPSKTM